MGKFLYHAVAENAEIKDAEYCNDQRGSKTGRCEERDSGKKLREAYAKVRARANGNGMAKANGSAMANGNGAMHGPSSDAQAIMACMTDGFARLEKTLERVAARA